MSKKRIYLPKTVEELKTMKLAYFEILWNRYFNIPLRNTKSSMIRPLWYEIQCENMHLKLPQKIITKLNRYSKAPREKVKRAYKVKYTISIGTELIKVFKGKEYKVTAVGESSFLYNNEEYKTLSAVAKEICGKKVSGYDFFGLNNKRIKYETE